MVRDGQPREVPLSELVPGDVVKLAAGDMIPADVRLLSCKDLFVIQASLTGESFPVEKFDMSRDEPAGPFRCWSCATSASWAPASKAARRQAVVVATGLQTYLGSMATAITSSRSRPASTAASAISPG